MIFLGNCTLKSLSHERGDSKASAEEKKFRLDKIIELILKTKADLKEGPDNI